MYFLCFTCFMSQCSSAAKWTPWGSWKIGMLLCCELQIGRGLDELFRFHSSTEVECRHIASIHQWQTMDISKFKASWQGCRSSRKVWHALSLSLPGNSSGGSGGGGGGGGGSTVAVAVMCSTNANLWYQIFLETGGEDPKNTLALCASLCMTTKRYRYLHI